MGRHHHHHLRLPDHLYLSPPPPPDPTFNLTSASLLAVKSAFLLSSTAPLFQETGRSKALAVGRIPGFRTSAAFLTTLRANLILDLDSASSLAGTPDVWQTSDFFSGISHPLSPSLHSAYDPTMADEDRAVTEVPKSTLDSLPELTTKSAVTEDDKVEALHLIADSVAQQRQLASSAIIFHPLTFSGAVLLFGLAYQYLYKGSRADWAIIGTTSAGLLMALLITVRWMTGEYIFEAERIGTWKWLDQGRDNADNGIVGTQDEVLLTRFGEEVIGAITVRGVRDPTSSTGKSRKNAPTTGVIRAWTVKRRYRRKGIGQGLLEEVATLCRNKGWSGPEFADDHANSAKIVWPTFSGGFRKREKQAREMLERVLEEQESNASPKKGKK